MNIYIGADHKGFQLKSFVVEALKKAGHQVADIGTNSEEVSCDYPKFSYDVATKVAQDKGSKGILICMTGIGHSIAANKVPGAYAALCYNKEAAVLSREHNNSNILVIGSKFVSETEVLPLIEAWLKTEFEGGRHQRRFEQIQEIEKKFLKN